MQQQPTSSLEHSPHTYSPAPAASLSGAQLVVAELLRRQVPWVVGIPGGAILPLYDALVQGPIPHVLARHEQAAGFIAQGAARMLGKAFVCLGTSGPGATNLLTAIADAKADSVPIVIITAQVPRALIGTDAFQEVDTCALARPITKASFQAQSADELAQLLPRAFELAESGRKGPVLLDIPKDVLNETTSRDTTTLSPIQRRQAVLPQPLARVGRSRRHSSTRLPRLRRGYVKASARCCTWAAAFTWRTPGPSLHDSSNTSTCPSWLRYKDWER